MGIKIHKTVDNGLTRWMFNCPACGNCHGPIEGRWTFNGDPEKPTFNPSILVRWTKTDPNGDLKKIKDIVCHSFVRDGKIEFLGDCTHELSGKTVDLPDWDD